MKEMKQLTKRGLALLLALALCMGMVCTSALAADTPDHTHNQDGWVCTQAEPDKALVCEEEHEHTDECYAVTEGEWSCVNAVQEFLDAVAALPGAGAVTADNAEAIGEQVNAVLDMYDAMSVENGERDDVTEALETVYAVYAAVLAAEEIDEGSTYAASSITKSAFENAYNLGQSDTCYGIIKLGEGSVTDSGTPNVWPTGNWEGAVDVTGYNWVHIYNSNPDVATATYRYDGGKLYITFTPGTSSGTTKISVGVDAKYPHYSLGTFNMELNFDYTVTNVNGTPAGSDNYATLNRSVVYDLSTGKATWGKDPYDNQYGERTSASSSCIFDFKDPWGYWYSFYPTKATNISVSSYDTSIAAVETYGFTTTHTWSERDDDDNVTHAWTGFKVTGLKAGETVVDITTEYDVQSIQWNRYTGTVWSVDDNRSVVTRLYIKVVGEKTNTDYELTYDANGGKFGTGEKALETVTQKQSSPEFTVMSQEPTLSGYTFLGWADTDDATTATYKAGNKITLTKETSPKTIYAVWEKAPDKTYTVTYTDGVEGQTVFPDQGYEELKKGDETPAFYPSDPTSYTDGAGNTYTFMGWSPAVNPVVSADDADENGNIVYTATWQKDAPVLKITGIQKVEVKNENDVPEAVKTALGSTTVTYRGTDESVTIPKDGSVTLLYKITVTGDQGKAYKVTDDKATYVGGDPMEGTIPEGGTAVIYVTKTFTASDINAQGKLVNTATVTPGKGNESSTSSTETTPAEEGTTPVETKRTFKVIYHNESGADWMSVEDSEKLGFINMPEWQLEENVTENPHDMTLSDKTPTRDGYTFAYWDWVGDKQFAPGDTITLTADPETLTEVSANLYAIWTKNPDKPTEYNVTYSWSGLPDNHGQTLPTGGKYAEYAEVTVNTSYPQGKEVTVGGVTYVFSGWSTKDATITGGKFTMPAKNVEITGTWSVKTPEPPNPDNGGSGDTNLLRVKVVCDSTDTNHGKSEHLRIRPVMNGITEYSVGEVVASKVSGYGWQCPVTVHTSDFKDRFDAGNGKNGAPHEYKEGTTDVTVMFYYKDGAWTCGDSDEELKELNSNIEIVREKNNDDKYFVNYVVFHVVSKTPEKPDKPTDKVLKDLRLGVQIVCDVQGSGHAATGYTLTNGAKTIGDVTANTGANKDQYPYTCTVSISTTQQNDYWLTQGMQGGAPKWNEDHKLLDNAQNLSVTLYWNGSAWVDLDALASGWHYMVIHTTHKPTDPVDPVKPAPVIKVEKTNDGLKLDENSGTLKVNYTVKITNKSGYDIVGLRLTDVMDEPTLKKVNDTDVGEPSVKLTFSNWKVQTTEGGNFEDAKLISGGENELTHVLQLLPRDETYRDEQTVTLTYTVEVESLNDEVAVKVKLDNEAEGASWINAPATQNLGRAIANALFRAAIMPFADDDEPDVTGKDDSSATTDPDAPDVTGKDNSTTGGTTEGGGSETEGVIPRKWTVSYSWTGLPEEATEEVPDSAKYLAGKPVTVDSREEGDTVTVGGETYKFSGWTVPVTVTDGEFTMPERDVVITGTWTKAEPEKPTQEPSQEPSQTPDIPIVPDIVVTPTPGVEPSQEPTPSAEPSQEPTPSQEPDPVESEQPSAPVESEQPDEEPSEQPSEDPGEDIDDPDTPLGELPEDPADSEEPGDPDEDLGDNDTPTGELPGDSGNEENPAKPEDPTQDGDESGEDIDDGMPPMGDVPQTGDNLGVWIAAAAVSGAGLMGIVGTTRKRKEDEEA